MSTEQLLALLRQMEWLSDDYGASCHFCGGEEIPEGANLAMLRIHRPGILWGHQSGCELAAALGSPVYERVEP